MANNTTTPGAPAINFGTVGQQAAPAATVAPFASKITPLGVSPSLASGIGASSGSNTLPVGATDSSSLSNVLNPDFAAGNGVQTNLGVSIPSSIAPSPAPAPAAPQPPAAAPAPLPPPAAPPGYAYSANGSLQPTNPGTTNATDGVSNSIGSSSVSGPPTTYADVLNALNENIGSYETNAQQNSDELAAEQGLLSAVRNAQDFQTNLTAGELNQYGVGRPAALDTGRAAQLGFNSQIGLQNVQNAESLAQTNLGLQQTNRQVRTTVANNVLQALQQEAGLQKPSPVSPGSSLVGPTGQVAFQGSGFTAPSASDIASLGSQFVANGQAPDLATGMAMAQQYLSSLQGSGGQQQPSSIEQANPSTSMATDDFLGYNLSTYATDPQYAQKLTPIVQQVSQDVTSYGPQGLQSYVSSQAPNSPITGQMVYQASSSYGVDPRLMMGMLQLESNFGTAGQATTTMNPGNVGNTGSSTQSFPSWQAGLNAMAQNLAIRQVSQSQAQAVGTQTQANPQVQPALMTMQSDGTPYLEQDKIPSAAAALAQEYSSQTGIPILSTDEVSKVQSIDNTKQALQQIGSIIPSILGSGVAGRFWQGFVVNNLESMTQSNPDIASYNSYRTTALNSIQALAGGSGSGLRLSQAEIDAATNNLPTITDNLETAQSKLAILSGYLNKWENTLLPNQSSNPNPSPSGQGDPLGILSQ
jgi:hypothetical protein